MAKIRIDLATDMNYLRPTLGNVPIDVEIGRRRRLAPPISDHFLRCQAFPVFSFRAQILGFG